ncbi:MAG TPA: glycosyltransferase family 4 protein [Gemmataceae bacterium]|nr:glycosyltransferase family 4 protein [Gemmataceae bacterium]
MKIAYITAGAGGMFCGSCLHDNTLVTALIAQGHDALLIPTYTPMRTDERDVSIHRVFFGGINVFLQQKLALFRHTPRLLDRLLDGRGLLRLVSRLAVKTKAEDLGDLTVSMLKGEHGYQRKEVERLVDWLAEEVRPDIVNLTNVLLSGIVHEVKRRLRVPVLGTLQGDDVFIEYLPERCRAEVLRLIREHCREMDGFIATSGYYADFMAGYLEIPRERIHVVYPGLNLAGHGGPRTSNVTYTIGYFARICPEKGLHNLVEAFRILRQMPDAPPGRLRVSGWLGDDCRAYLDDLVGRLQAAGLAEDFEHVECPNHDSKVRFLQSLDVLSVPTTYREPKGLYVLEALANGVPVVQPRHGSFPELIEATGGGLLVEPDNPQDLARGLHQLVTDTRLRHQLGQQGKQAVCERFHAERMARETAEVYSGYLGAPAPVA